MTTSNLSGTSSPIDILFPMVIFALLGALLFGMIGASAGGALGIAIGAIIGSREPRELPEDS